MIKLRFYNSLGEVVFGEKAWHLTEAEGLGNPTKLLTAARYLNQPGQTTTSCVANPRTITLSGDINLAKSGADAISKGCSVLDWEGILEVTTDRFVRQIKARCIELVFGERNGPFRSFVAQFLCDCPYFEDIEYTGEGLFDRQKLLTKNTVLPAMFSKRIMNGNVEYKGSAFSEPIIHVEVPNGTGIITIYNTYTQEYITIRYDGSQFSELDIDVENRTLTDEKGVQRFDILADDSFFDGFTLRHGINTITVINSNPEAEVTVNMKYKVRYAEAVV